MSCPYDDFHKQNCPFMALEKQVTDRPSIQPSDRHSLIQRCTGASKKHNIRMINDAFRLPDKQVWSTNRCVLSTFFSTFNMDRSTDQQAYFPIEMQFYISAMFVGFPDEIHEERPSFIDFEINWLRTDGPTDGRTGRADPLYRDARTHLKKQLF